jgi:predicted ATPase/transcriptional regulator with XRE-family HTH domain
MSEAVFFGEWIAQRRKMLDITQREFAARTNYALSTIKKIETGERRPSRELAASIASALRIPADKSALFVECARGLRSVQALQSISTTSPAQTEAAVVPLTVDLPPNSTPMIGRTVELAQIAELLNQPECRLLTLVGTGGVGKTRLALEAARAQRDRFSDGVVMIPLAAVTDISLIPMAIAQSLRVTLASSAHTQLVAYLHDKTMLLVLDNCEQLIEGIGWLSDLLNHAPGIKLLTTSRERLQLVEEWLYPVPMLDEAQAVALFDQTARRLNPHFQLAEQHAAVVTICRLIENLPLATELAASWTPFMACAAIAENIQRDIDFLSATTRNMPERHRSIRAVFEHSWRLLTPAEQNVMMRLSVFRGGWTSEEGETIAGGTRLLLRALVEKSLVHITGYGRYNLHELIRQFAADQLSAAGKELETRQQHADVYLALAGMLDAQLHTANGITAFARLDHEQDNMRAALNWALATGSIDQARQLFDKLSLYWWRRGHWAEGEAWAKALDARPDEADSTLLCWTLMDAAFFLTLQGNFMDALPYMARAEAMAVRLEDPETTLRVLIVQVQAPSDIESAAAAFDIFFATAEQVREHSKSGLEAMVAAGHDIYGDRLYEVGRIKEAEAQYRQSLDLWRRMGNVDAIAYPIGNLGRLALQAGRVQEAYDYLSESVVIARTIGNRVGIADWLPHLGNVLLTMGDVAQAEACYEETLALCEEIGNSVAYANVLAYLGYTALIQCETAQSWDALRRSLTAFRSFGDTQQILGVDWRALLPPEFLLSLRGMALLNVMEERFERALRLFSAAAALQSQLGQGADLGMQARVDEALQTLKSKLTQETFAKIWEAGQSISPEAIMEYALNTS